MAPYPFSWSSVSDYRTCALQYYHKRVLKDLPWVETDAIKWGNEVHTAMELNLLQGKALEGRFTFLIPLADKLNAMPGDHYGEQKLAVDIDLNPVDYWGKDAWGRAILDRLIIDGGKGLNLDYKTGKRKPFSPQLSMSTAIAMAHFPDLDIAGAAYLWTQGGKPTSKIIKRSDIELIWAPFRETLKDMEWSHANNAWPATPNGLCRDWCPVLSCLHNGQRRRK